MKNEFLWHVFGTFECFVFCVVCVEFLGFFFCHDQKKVQAILLNTVLITSCREDLVFPFVVPPSSASWSRRRMPRKGWSTMEVPDGWLKIIRGPRPQSSVVDRRKAAEVLKTVLSKRPFIIMFCVVFPVTKLETAPWF